MEKTTKIKNLLSYTNEDQWYDEAMDTCCVLFEELDATTRKQLYIEAKAESAQWAMHLLEVALGVNDEDAREYMLSLLLDSNDCVQTLQCAHNLLAIHKSLSLTQKRMILSKLQEAMEKQGMLSGFYESVKWVIEQYQKT